MILELLMGVIMATAKKPTMYTELPQINAIVHPELNTYMPMTREKRPQLNTGRTPRPLRSTGDWTPRGY